MSGFRTAVRFRPLARAPAPSSWRYQAHTTVRKWYKYGVLSVTGAGALGGYFLSDSDDATATLVRTSVGGVIGFGAGLIWPSLPFLYGLYKWAQWLERKEQEQHRSSNK